MGVFCPSWVQIVMCRVLSCNKFTIATINFQSYHVCIAEFSLLFHPFTVCLKLWVEKQSDVIVALFSICVVSNIEQIKEVV